jgi:hypothetical protein
VPECHLHPITGVFIRQIDLANFTEKLHGNQLEVQFGKEFIIRHACPKSDFIFVNFTEPLISAL